MMKPALEAGAALTCSPADGPPSIDNRVVAAPAHGRAGGDRDISGTGRPSELHPTNVDVIAARFGAKFRRSERSGAEHLDSARLTVSVVARAVRHAVVGIDMAVALTKSHVEAYVQMKIIKLISLGKSQSEDRTRRKAHSLGVCECRDVRVHTRA